MDLEAYNPFSTHWLITRITRSRGVACWSNGCRVAWSDGARLVGSAPGAVGQAERCCEKLWALHGFATCFVPATSRTREVALLPLQAILNGEGRFVPKLHMGLGLGFER